jgi:hypothetical protein
MRTVMTDRRPGRSLDSVEVLNSQFDYSGIIFFEELSSLHDAARSGGVFHAIVGCLYQ